MKLVFGFRKSDGITHILNYHFRLFSRICLVLRFSHTQQVLRKRVLVLITMMAANNLDLWDAKEESSSHIQFQEVNCLKMHNFYHSLSSTHLQWKRGNNYKRLVIRSQISAIVLFFCLKCIFWTCCHLQDLKTLFLSV